MYKLDDDEQEYSKQDILDLREKVLPLVLDIIKRVTESDEGYTLNFDSSDRSLSLLVRWLNLERIVNDFLRFHLYVESANGPVRLELSGPSGTKDFLQSELNLKRWL